ncbi:MAG: hypothetical protein O2783_02635 [Chloroflexi bacterium]|nr:hypothetical protein [Chloroflexota bacterium]
MSELKTRTTVFLNARTVSASKGSGVLGVGVGCDVGVTNGAGEGMGVRVGVGTAVAVGTDVGVAVDVGVGVGLGLTVGVGVVWQATRANTRTQVAGKKALQGLMKFANLPRLQKITKE